ncbi:hypothetical protein BHAOGJBA_4229 [Methylobacterium hispanicum]|uniref:Uncharacterized protein n=1 Tax=Methylobacterium hispanicum TaxID=270350 RepID=A0AAV4ZR68_9HYPH|nr:hypothetical protein [Methylobacterium hispanicum]GJD90687.1 hypothetical protein BHAOGJBA_4229 [Methylobacterium hispanicum]
MKTSRKIAERYFDTPTRTFGPSGLQAGLSRLKAVAIVAGVLGGVPAATIFAAAAGEAYRDARPQAAQVLAGDRAAEAAAPVRGPASGIRGGLDGDAAARRPQGERRLELEAGAPPAMANRGRGAAYEVAGYGVPSFGAGGRARDPHVAGAASRTSSGDYLFRADPRSEPIEVGRDVVQNISAASRMVGIDPALVMALSWRSAIASEGGALPATGMRVGGMFAYGEQRFLEELVRWGGSLGLHDVVAGIRRTPRGEYVAVGHARDAVDGLRQNIHASSVLGAANAKSAAAFLADNALGRTNPADILVAIQFGSDVALSLVRARMTNPHQPMTGPLADVVAGMGLAPIDASGRTWTVTSFNEATETRLRTEMRAFASMRGMELSEQHRPVAPEGASYRPAPR